MENITILANAKDNSGGPVSLSASVTINEPQQGLGDGDTPNDWTQPVINQATGTISLQLRAERSGSGNGRTGTSFSVSPRSCAAAFYMIANGSPI